MKKLIIAVLICGLLTGCSAFKKENPNQLKKSPCACMPMDTKQG